MTHKGIYRHYKGNTYEVLGEVDNETNDKKKTMVLYIDEQGNKFVRDFQDFHGIVIRDNGTTVMRFEHMHNAKTIKDVSDIMTFKPKGQDVSE